MRHATLKEEISDFKCKIEASFFESRIKYIVNNNCLAAVYNIKAPQKIIFEGLLSYIILKIELNIFLDQGYIIRNMKANKLTKSTTP